MKKLSISLLFLVCALPLHAQLGNVVMVFSHGAPSGACPNSFTQDTDLTNNNVYGCSSAGTWFQIGGVTGGGTVSSVGTSSPLSGGPITTSGTITLGTVPVTDGGTGATTLTGVIKGNGTSAMSAAASSDIISLFSTCSGTQYLGADGACHSAGVGTVTSITAGTGLTGGTITGSGTVALSTPVSVANGGTGVSTAQGTGPKVQLSTGTTTSNDCVKFDANGNTVDAGAACGSGSGGFPSGVGLAGATVSGTGSTSQSFIPTVDVRWFFTNPFPTYSQAQSQDFGAVLNAAFVAATASGACVDVSGLNLLNAPNVTVLYASTNPFSGLTSNTYTPCLIGANFQVVTGATWATPAGAMKIAGGVPGGIGGTGLVVQPCNTSTTCAGSGGFTVNQFPTSATCATPVTGGGLNCYATGLPSSSALTTITTGTVSVTLNSTTVTATSGTPWDASVVGGTFISDCGSSNTCTVGSTSTYVSGRIVAESGGNTLTLQSVYLGATNTARNYVIFKPNTSVVWCDGCLGNSLQKSFTGHEIDDLSIDLNGISGAGFYTKSSQEGSVLNDYTCFIQLNTNSAATAGGTCLAWDQSVREASGSGQTFLGHWSVYGGRIGMGQNAGGSSTFGVVVEGFSAMDGSVALSQANGPSVFELQAIIGGGGSAKFQDAAYIDGITGMYIAGTHTESTLNDHWNIGPLNPVYNLSLNNITSSGTLGGCTVELHIGTSGNRISGVSRPSGGCLAEDDSLSTPTLATSVSGTPASWTMPEYIQQGNAGVGLLVSGNAVFTGVVTATSYQWVGPLYIQGPIPSSAMSPSTSGNSAIGTSSDGNLYQSNNGGAIDEFATAANTLTFSNKLISGSTNTFSNIANASLTNSAITIAGTSVSLGGSTSSFPSPGAIGGTTAAAGTFTTLTANTSLVINGGTAQTGTQGTDTKLLTAGTISGTGAGLCTDANGGATTSGCSSGTVTSFSGDGTLITNSGSTGAVTATLGTAGAHKWWGNNTGSTATPGYETIGTADLPAIPLSGLATQAANTVLGNFTGLTATPTATSVASCSGSNDAEIYTTSTGFGCGTNFVQNSVTNTGTSAMTLNMSASTSAPSVQLPPVVGGTILAGTSTANLSAPVVFQNTNSTNNNTSITMGVTSPGTSTGQTTLNINGASTGGDLLDLGTGGTWTAGVLSGQTIVARVTNGGLHEGTFGVGSTAHGVVISEGTTTAAVATAAGTAGQVMSSGGASADPSYGDMWLAQYIPSANCVNAVAGSGWSLGASGVVACRAGTNNTGGYVTITDTSSSFAEFSTVIPFDWDTASNPYIRVYFASATDTTSGHTVIPAVKISCSQAVNGTTTDDATLTASQSLSTTTFGASAVANGIYSGSNVQLGSTQMSGCVAGGLFIVQLGRATDTATGNINFYGASITWPHKTPGTGQAN